MLDLKPLERIGLAAMIVVILLGIVAVAGILALGFVPNIPTQTTGGAR